MPIVRKWPSTDDRTLKRFIIQTFGHARRTQDTPIAPDVWYRLFRIAEAQAQARHEGRDPPQDTVDILISPWSGASPGEIASYLCEGSADRPETQVEMVAINAGYVVASVNFQALVLLVMPMTQWWQQLDERFWMTETPYGSYEEILASKDTLREVLQKSGNNAIQYFRFAAIAGLIEGMRNSDVENARKLMAITKKFVGLAGADAPPDETGIKRTKSVSPPDKLDFKTLILPFERHYFGSLDGSISSRRKSDYDQSHRSLPEQRSALRKALVEPHIYSANLNRPAAPMLIDSRRTVKADAAQRVFSISTDKIAFAVIDGGIDAMHPAFVDRSYDKLGQKLKPASGQTDPAERSERLRRSRVLKTYDFTRLRAIQTAVYHGVDRETPQLIKKMMSDPQLSKNIDHLKARRKLARDLDWAIVEPLIELRHDDEANYEVPIGGHGTHVAGILAADLSEPTDAREPILGVCPDLKLYDFRVFDKDGQSDEFTILSAVEFVGWLNRNRDYPVIHGANLSLALRHHVDSYACGRTPICEACNRLADSGTVVVAAAGNTGFDTEANKLSLGSGYRSISITDPGNAEAVITVGATHRRDPHAYGVSYFSSRGPTGDGRRKPDLVAPGEKIISTIPGGKTERMDGTSMAAPHVSGAAALLMARHPELIGRPSRIKQILMSTATDIGREREFQGAGLVDVLRALQSI